MSLVPEEEKFAEALDQQSSASPYPHASADITESERRTARRVFGTDNIEIANPERHKHLIQPLCALCAQHGISDIPKMLVAHSPVINSSRLGNTIIVSDGLSETLDPGEVQAVISHELIHYKNRERESVISHIWEFFVDIAAAFGTSYLFKQARPKAERTALEKNLHLSNPLLHIVPIHYVAIAPTHALIQRHQEFKADEEGAKVAGYDNMIGALKYLQALHEQQESKLPKGIGARMREYGVLGAASDLLYPYPDHPSFAERIAALEASKHRHQPETRVSSVAHEDRQNAPSTHTVQ